MERKALIIANPGLIGQEDYLSGVNKDVEQYTAFLLSPEGGSWTEDEIQILRKPPALTLRKAARQLQDADYALVVFSGHGYQNDAPILNLGNDEMDSRELLRLRAPRETLILDCCRKARPLREVRTLAKSIMEAATPLNPRRCRWVYDKMIEQSATGIIELCACTRGEYSYDRPTGGLYSYNLIDSALEWNKRTNPSEPSYISVIAAHNMVAQRIEQYYGALQTPQIEFKPKSGPYYPFCVVA